MANKSAAVKYLRQSQKRRMRNKPVRTFARSSVRDALDAIDDAVDTQDWNDADDAIQRAVRALDRAAQRGVIHAVTLRPSFDHAPVHRSRRVRLTEPARCQRHRQLGDRPIHASTDFRTTR